MNTERLTGLLGEAKLPWRQDCYDVRALGSEEILFDADEPVSRLIVEAVNALPHLLSRLAALEEALKPFADVAEGEVYTMFVAESKSTFRLTNGNATRTLTFINAECFDRARATLAWSATTFRRTPMDSVSKEAVTQLPQAECTDADYAAAKHFKHWMFGDDTMTELIQAFADYRARFQEATRLAVVEECAAVADRRKALWAAQHNDGDCSMSLEEECEDIAAAIRALQPKVAGQ